MSGRVAIISVSIAAAFSFLLISKPALAECAEITDQEKYDQADLVGIGNVTAISGGGPYIEFTGLFKVSHELAYNEILIVEEYPQTSIGIPWQDNQSYLLYLSRTSHKQRFETTVCSGTRLYQGRYTQEELVSLGVGERTPLELPPQKPALAPSSPGTPFSIESIGSILGRYESEFGPNDVILPRSSLALTILAWALLLITWAQRQLRRAASSAPQHSRLIWIILGFIMLNIFFLIFQPTNWVLSHTEAPFYAAFTPPAYATAGCANLALAIYNFTTSITTFFLGVLIVILLLGIIRPTVVDRHPKFVSSMMITLIIIQAIPFLSLIAQAQFLPGCR